MDKSDFISRIAPTPSGYLHIGNGVNFLLTWLFIRSNSGVLHLRIDDTDTQRVQTRYIDNVFETLEFLNIDWDRGAKSSSDYFANYKFELHCELYKKKLDYVRQKTSLLYPCRCSRKEIRQTSVDGLYPKTCFQKDITYDATTCAIRVHIPANTPLHVDGNLIQLDECFGDFVVWRKGDVPSYQFASLVQDEMMRATHIVRGYDLLNSSAAQRYMAKVFHFENFQKVCFFHHPLLYNENRVKLSKSKEAKSILKLGSAQIVYKEVSSMLGLESGAEESIESLLEAYKREYKGKDFKF